MSIQAVATRGPARSRLWVGPGCALLVILALLAVAVMAPLIAPYSPETQNLLGRLKPPRFASRGRVYWLGSDELGRDLLSRLVWGARVSLLVATASVLLSAVVGTILGMVAGYRRGAVEVVLMRIVDVFLSIPAILFAIILVAVLGPGLTNVVVVLALTRWPRHARVAYAQTLAVSVQPYVRLARFMGAGTVRVLVLHVLPNILGALVVVMTLEFGQMVLFEAGLSFLGLGVQEPYTSWGVLISEGAGQMESAPWMLIYPALFLGVTLFCFNFIGDGLRDALDPKDR